MGMKHSLAFSLILLLAVAGPAAANEVADAAMNRDLEAVRSLLDVRGHLLNDAVNGVDADRSLSAGAPNPGPEFLGIEIFPAPVAFYDLLLGTHNDFIRGEAVSAPKAFPSTANRFTGAANPCVDYPVFYVLALRTTH